MSVVLKLELVAAFLLARRATANVRRASYVRRPVLNENEFPFFKRLVESIPAGYYVRPQLGMAAALNTHDGSAASALAAFRTISQKRIDFCICDRLLVPRLVVELDDHSHDVARDAARDALLRCAGIPTLRFDVRWMPTTHQLQAAIAAACNGGV